DLAAMDTRISVKARNKSFEEVMQRLLKGHYLSYQVSDNGVVIITEDAAAPQAISVTGTVVDEFDDPIPGVSVSIKGLAGGVVTDDAGRYSLTVADEQAVIVFSYIGFTTVEQVVGDNTVINVLMK